MNNKRNCTFLIFLVLLIDVFTYYGFTFLVVSDVQQRKIRIEKKSYFSVFSLSSLFHTRPLKTLMSGNKKFFYFSIDHSRIVSMMFKESFII